METRNFRNIGKDISLLGFGCMRLPLLHPEKQDIDYAQADKMVDAAMAAGVNYFDTAWPYHGGMSETFIGQSLKRYPRESFNLATKIPTFAIQSADDVERIFAEQLKKCQVDYFDFYLVHSLNEANYKTVKNVGIYELLKKKKEQGLIRHLGFSFHDHPNLLERIVTDYEWDFGQIQLNYVDWEATDAKRLYEILSSRGIPVVIMEPVRGGALATLTPQAADLLKKAAPEASTASWAIRYAASLPGVMCVLSGMSDAAQVADNLKTMQNFKPLTDAERKLITEAATMYRAAGVIPCTGCRYCMDCPSGVDIPRVFAIYNHARAVGRPFVFQANYRSLAASEQAHNCVACGVCMGHCPQGIRIPERMREIVEFAATLQ